MSCKLSLKRKEQKERRSITTYIDVLSCPVGGGHWDCRFLLFWLFSRSLSVFVPKNFGFSVLVFIAVCGFSVF